MRAALMATLLLAGGLAGCGQKGPLTLPGATPATAVPAASAASGAAVK